MWLDCCVGDGGSVNLGTPSNSLSALEGCWERKTQKFLPSGPLGKFVWGSEAAEVSAMPRFLTS